MSVTFSYPAFASTQVSTITIPSPEMGDGEASTYSVTVHLTRASDFKSVVTQDRDEQIYATTLDFITLCEDDKILLEDFLIAAQGEYILYTDYNSKEWYCVVTDDEIEFIATGRGPSYSISLTMNRWEKV